MREGESLEGGKVSRLEISLKHPAINHHFQRPSLPPFPFPFYPPPFNKGPTSSLTLQNNTTTSKLTATFEARELRSTSTSPSTHRDVLRMADSTNILLVFVHGFKGDDSTFKKFPGESSFSCYSLTGRFSNEVESKSRAGWILTFSLPCLPFHFVLLSGF